MALDQEVAHKLLQIKAIKLNPQNPFTWASGLRSPIYCDNRVALSFPDVRNFMKQALVEKSQAFAPFNMVAGVATAGIAYGALLADALDLPFVYVRSSSKAHGRQNIVEGHLRGNERVLVIEDLISTGGSSLRAVQVLEAMGCHIAGVLAVFSYELPAARANFAKEHCPYASLSNYSMLLEAALERGYIDVEELVALNEWRLDPEAWSARAQGI
jgi:orotate phosphoribosyltransferase